LKIFGEVCIRTLRKGHQDKSDNQGDVCIFVGYPDNHYHDTYRLLNVETKKIAESRDVRCIGKMFREYREEFLDAEEEENYGLSVAIQPGPMEPKKFKSAWFDTDTKEREGWREAIKQESTNMDKRNVWEIINKSSIPANRKTIGC
jgi:hypothetical protein